jgi:hypothetical protein
MKSGNLFRVITIGIGWLLYCDGWLRILHVTSRREPLSFAVVLAGAALVLSLGVHLWIAHNRRLAAAGHRGNMTRYTSPSYSHDHLGRELVLDGHLTLAREVVVSATGDRKVYVIAAETMA